MLAVSNESVAPLNDSESVSLIQTVHVNYIYI